MSTASYTGCEPTFLYGPRVPEGDVNLAYTFIEAPKFETAVEIQDTAIPALLDAMGGNQGPPLIFNAANDGSGILINTTTNSPFVSVRHIRLTNLFVADKCDAAHALILRGELACRYAGATDSIPANVSDAYADPKNVNLNLAYADGTAIAQSSYRVRLRRIDGAPPWVYEATVYVCWTPQTELGLLVSYPAAMRSAGGEWIVAPARRVEHLAQHSAMESSRGDFTIEPALGGASHIVRVPGARTVNASPGCLFRWGIRGSAIGMSFDSPDITSYVAQQDGVKIIADGKLIKDVFATECPRYASALGAAALLGATVTYAPVIRIPPADAPPHMNTGANVVLTVNSVNQVCASTSVARTEPAPGETVTYAPCGCWAKVSLAGSDVTEEQFAWQASVKEKTLRVNAPRGPHAHPSIKGVGDGQLITEIVMDYIERYKDDYIQRRGGDGEWIEIENAYYTGEFEQRSWCSATWGIFVPRLVSYDWSFEVSDGQSYDAPRVEVNGVRLTDITPGPVIDLPGVVGGGRQYTCHLALAPGWNKVKVTRSVDRVLARHAYLRVQRMYPLIEVTGLSHYAIDSKSYKYPPQTTERTIAVRHSETVQYGHPITIDAKDYAVDLDAGADLEWLSPVSCDNANVKIDEASDYQSAGVFTSSVKQSSTGQAMGSIVLRRDGIAENERVLLASWQQLASLFGVTNRSDDELRSMYCCLDDNSWNIMARFEREATGTRYGGPGTKLRCYDMKANNIGVVAYGAISLRQMGPMFALQELVPTSGLCKSSSTEWYDPWHLDIPDIVFTREILLPGTSHPMYNSLWPELKPYAGQMASCRYNIPEYESQAWVPAYPAACVTEVPRLYNENTLIVSYPPYMPDGWDSIQLSTDTRVVDVDPASRLIMLDHDVTREMPITVQYRAIVRSYRYVGYTQNNGGVASIVSLNLNPGPYQVSSATPDRHVYGHVATTQYEEVPTSELVGIPFTVYLVPTLVRVNDTTVATRQKAAYHTTYTPVELEEIDALTTPLGIVSMKQTARPEDVVVIDTRRRGGGLSESIDREEATFDAAMSHWDIGRWDGQVYVDGGVVLIDLVDDSVSADLSRRASADVAVPVYDTAAFIRGAATLSLSAVRDLSSAQSSVFVSVNVAILAGTVPFLASTTIVAVGSTFAIAQVDAVVRSMDCRFDIIYKERLPEAEPGPVDIVFVFDTSGSMGGPRNNIMNNLDVFIDALDAPDWRIGLVSYEASPSIVLTDQSSRWAATKSEFAELLGKLVFSGGIENGLTAIKYAVEQYDWRDGIVRHIVLVTDEDADDHSTIGDIVAFLQENNAILHAIVNYDNCTPYLNLAEATGGMDFSVAGSFGESLAALGSEIVKWGQAQTAQIEKLLRVFADSAPQPTGYTLRQVIADRVGVSLPSDFLNAESFQFVSAVLAVLSSPGYQGYFVPSSDIAAGGSDTTYDLDAYIYGCWLGA